MIDLISIIFAFVVLYLTKKDIRYGLGGFILISIFPNIQGREMFGITGFNAMNLIFFGLLLKYYLPRFTGKRNQEVRKISSITPLILILLFLQIIFTIRFLAEFDDIGLMGVINAFNTYLLKPFQYYIVLHILYNNIRTLKDIKTFFILIFIATFLGAIVLFWQYTFLSYSRTEMWWNDFAGHKNTYGVKIAFFVLIAIIFYYYSQEKKIKMFSLIGLIIGGGVLIFSLSRTAWVAFLIGLLFFIHKSKLKKLYLIFPVVFVIIASTPLWNVVAERMIETKTDEGSQFNQITAGRVEKKWEPQIKGIEENPIFGGGTVGLLGHSGYLSTWNQLGLLGLIISIAVFLKMYLEINVLYKALPNKKGISKAFALTVLTLIITLPMINVTGSLQFFRNADVSSVFIILFFYLTSKSLKEIIIKDYFLKRNSNISIKKPLITISY